MRQLAVTYPVYAPTPFPPDAAAYYVSGGCWNLAIALHSATGGLPIEALFRGEGPKHAVVVDGATTLDAFGRRLLRHARAGFDEWRDVTPDGLLALLAALPTVTR